jgi:hypothetical protein
MKRCGAENICERRPARSGRQAALFMSPRKAAGFSERGFSQSGRWGLPEFSPFGHVLYGLNTFLILFLSVGRATALSAGRIPPYRW